MPDTLPETSPVGRTEGVAQVLPSLDADPSGLYVMKVGMAELPAYEFGWQVQLAATPLSDGSFDAAWTFDTYPAGSLGELPPLGHPIVSTGRIGADGTFVVDVPGFRVPAVANPVGPRDIRGGKVKISGMFVGAHDWCGVMTGLIHEPKRIELRRGVVSAARIGITGSRVDPSLECPLP